MNDDIHVLLVDDDRAIVHLISESLKDEGYKVTSAYNGQEALDIIRQDRQEFAILILDIMMPGMDGLELCRQIRAKFAAPILLLSGKDREFDKVIGLEIGADDYVTKPFMIGELVSRVKAHIRRDRRNQLRRSDKDGILAFDNLLINKVTFEVYKNEERIPYRQKNFKYSYTWRNIAAAYCPVSKFTMRFGGTENTGISIRLPYISRT